mgnify:CR=1 FL=1
MKFILFRRRWASKFYPSRKWARWMWRPALIMPPPGFIGPVVFWGFWVFELGVAETDELV